MIKLLSLLIFLSAEVGGHLKHQVTTEKANTAQLLDLRLNTGYSYEGFSSEFELETVGSYRNNFLIEPRTLIDLTVRSVSEEDFFLDHRLDRANIGYRSENYVFKVGRQAYSLGNGLAFQVLDLLNPFSPVEIDPDYKTGTDIVYSEYLLSGGQSLEALYVPREFYEDSYAAVFRTEALQFLATHHYNQWNFGFGSAWSISESVFRFDFRIDEDSKNSLLVNLDTSWIIYGLNAYTFAEYYLNGYGSARSTPSPDALELVLRGENFVTGREFAVLGAQLEATPLINLSLLGIFSINNSSGFIQNRVQISAYQNIDIQLGVNVPYGDEFVIATEQAFLRTSWYF